MAETDIEKQGNWNGYKMMKWGENAFTYINFYMVLYQARKNFILF